MSNKTLIIVWVLALILCFFLMRFGVSDLLGSKAPSVYYEHNPMRPFFRLAFGMITTIITLGTAILISAKIKSSQ